MSDTKSPSRRRVHVCETCGGTGFQLLSRSGYISDGYRRERCGICGGTGESDYHHHDRPFVNEQKRRRLAPTPANDGALPALGVA